MGLINFNSNNFKYAKMTTWYICKKKLKLYKSLKIIANFIIVKI
ncbi:hypothetical protein BD847_0996 [Flavobacterium cutihirudinis]|uniref:Uncharacterized protein n=1 Tax=Flavobacterium cutihirudinis TaxID=1265740 RepID=A0A3D9G1M0_9FLAO|nr:hypothetical protein BD847_0996 [Flavobacterium cutihirudinis]